MQDLTDVHNYIYWPHDPSKSLSSLQLSLCKFYLPDCPKSQTQEIEKLQPYQYIINENYVKN